MNTKRATQLAERAIHNVEGGKHTYVHETVVLIKEADGTYSVTDNGEEVNGLDKAGAIRIMVENLTN
jgi:hypothetical protein